MNTVYYKLSYKTYKEHAPRLHGGFAVAFSEDRELTDDSIMTMKVQHAEHVHHYLERQDGITVLSYTDPAVQAAAVLHPIMKPRGHE